MSDRAWKTCVVILRVCFVLSVVIILASIQYYSYLSKISPRYSDGIHTVVLGNHGVDFYATPIQAIMASDAWLIGLAGMVLGGVAEIISRTIQGD